MSEPTLADLCREVADLRAQVTRLIETVVAHLGQPIQVQALHERLDATDTRVHTLEQMLVDLAERLTVVERGHGG